MKGATIAPETRLRIVRHGGRLARFGAVGVFNVATEFIVFGALLKAGVAPLIANALGFLAANIQSYFVNARVTFGSDGKSAPLAFGNYGRFFLAHCLSLAISTAFVAFLGPVLAREFGHDAGMMLAKAPAVALGFLANYAMSAIFIFRRPPES